MGKQRAPLEFNRLTGGIITEASPLTFPDNASLDEVNFELLSDGTRKRRLGFDFEEGYELIETTFGYTNGSPSVVHAFLWENVSGRNEISYVVIQLDNKLYFFRTTQDTLSLGIINQEITVGGTAKATFDFASIDGSLVVVYGSADILTISVDLTNEASPVFSQRIDQLTTRDLFGIQSWYDRSEEAGSSFNDVIDLTDPLYYSKRPEQAGLTATGTAYSYNLRNQTFANARLPKEGADSVDPIEYFIGFAQKYPAMSDTVSSALYPNVEDDDNKTADRFHAEDLIDNPLGTAPAPKGYFIIDALNRSTSRYERWEELLVDEGFSTAELTTLPTDITPGGATVVTEYGGRLWYGGFSELGSNTSEGGTRLESYVLYSQLANNSRVVTRCYQSGDPTSIATPDLLETDGGFLSLDGAYGIGKMVPVGTSLLVFAENGVWAISGLDGNYFSPTSPRLQKITDKGSVSSRAIVVIDTSIIYWTKSGIYAIRDNNGTYDVENLVDKTIQSLYDEIPYVNKRTASGSYDSYSSEVLWVTHNTVSRDQPTEVLVLKTNSGAFTKYTISDNEDNSNTTLVGFVNTPPYTLQGVEEEVTVNGEVVTLGFDEGFEPITVTEERLDNRRFDTKGIILSTVDGGTLSNLSFGEFNNESFLDWGTTDATAYMITGYASGGDLQRRKQTPYITTHFQRTEDGFYADENGDLQLSNPSGCLIQAQWDWANSVNSGRWSREAQAYRYPRHYMPADVDDPFDTGFATITTRNKIRGSGRVLSMQFKTEVGKDCHILGWSTVIGVNEDV